MYRVKGFAMLLVLLKSKPSALPMELPENYRLFLAVSHNLPQIRLAMRMAGRWVRRLTMKQEIHTGPIISRKPPGMELRGKPPSRQAVNQCITAVMITQKMVLTTRFTRISKAQVPFFAPHFSAKAKPHVSVGMKNAIRKAMK